MWVNAEGTVLEGTVIAAGEGAYGMIGWCNRLSQALQCCWAVICWKGVHCTAHQSARSQRIENGRVQGWGTAAGWAWIRMQCSAA